MSDRDVWWQVVARVDARIDEGGALAGTELEHALRRWPDGYEGQRELPSLWLQLHPGTGARHPALAHLELAPLTSAEAVEHMLDSLRAGVSAILSTYEHGWVAACLALARSPAALVVPRIAVRLVEMRERLIVTHPGVVTELPAQWLCLIAAHLRDADESKDLLPVLLELLDSTTSSITGYLASLAMIEIGKSMVEARSQIESMVRAEGTEANYWNWRGRLCEIAACVGVELTATQRRLCAGRQIAPMLDPSDPSLSLADRLLAERAALTGLDEPARNQRIVELAESIFKPRPRYEVVPEPLRIEVLRYIDGASGFGLARIQMALGDPSARVRTRALLRLRELGPRGSVAVEQVLERVRASPLWWERIAALRCLPAIIDDDRRASVGETLIEAAVHARTPYERDELEVIGDMILSGWRP